MVLNSIYIRWKIILSAVLIIGFFPGAATAKDIVRIGVPRNLPPYAFIDPNSGDLRGFCIDLALLLAADMGVKPQFFGISRPRLEERLSDNSIDLIIGFTHPEEEREDLSTIETGLNIDAKIFVNKSCVTVTCGKDLRGQTVAVEKGRNLKNFIENTEGVKFIEVENQREALSYVNSDNARAYLSSSSLTTRYFIQKNDFKNIKEVGIPVDSVPLTIAMKKDNADFLKEVSVSFGKVFESENYELINRKWLGREIQFSHWDKYLKHVIAALGLIAAVLFVFIFWNFILKRKVEQVTRDFQQSEKKYRDLIESSPEMIHLISPDGSIRLVNEIAVKHLGYSEVEMVSLRLQDIVPPEQSDDMGVFILDVFREGFRNKEFDFQAKDGTWTPVEMIATTISSTEDGALMACCFSRDITGRKRLEEELIESERLAIMGQMAAGLAHEINNPLGIILANAEDVLANDLDSEDNRESLKTIERNAIRAGKIIEDLLSFTGPSSPARRPTDLLQLIDESLPFLKQKLNNKKINVKKVYPEGQVIIHGDENQIQQLIINLVLNAVQAMSENGTLTIRTQLKENGNGRMVLLDVEDTGVGVPEGDLSKIFNPFFTSRKEKGFGLGLFISRVIVEKHRGKIYARQKADQGTIIRVELPV